MKIGGSASKSSSSMNQTTTPLAPSWVSPQAQSLATGTANLANADPTSYVAGADPLQTQAATAAAGLTQNGAAYDTANQTLTGLTTAGANAYDPATVHPNSILPNLAAYMSPYQQDVVNSTLANYDRSAGSSRQQAVLNLAKLDDTFGGSGGQSYLGNFDAANQLNRAQTESTLLDQGFQTGANLANLDADRRQNAQQFNANAFNTARQFNAGETDTAQARQAAVAQQLTATDQARNADARANIGAQGDIGSIMQQIQQAIKSAPLSVQQAINSAYGSLVPVEQLLTGSNTTGTSKGTNMSVGASVGWTPK